MVPGATTIPLASFQMSHELDSSTYQSECSGDTRDDLPLSRPLPQHRTRTKQDGSGARYDKCAAPAESRGPPFQRSVGGPMGPGLRGKAFWWRFHALRVGNAGGELTRNKMV